MTTSQKMFIFLPRVALGWLFFYAGITKVVNPEWTSAGYLGGAKAFTGFYQWLTQPGIIGVVDFLNEWGLTLLGVSLILGLGVRLSAVLGALLMLLYYVPLGFPYPNANSYIVDQHIVYALALLMFAAIRAGRVWGLDDKIWNIFSWSRPAGVQKWLG
jgi:thiosulfate dehydrogenase (quinone) large subunit